MTDVNSIYNLFYVNFTCFNQKIYLIKLFLKKVLCRHPRRTLTNMHSLWEYVQCAPVREVALLLKYQLST